MNSFNFARGADRFRLAPTCPCGKNNKDLKFSPDKNDSTKGKCFSCGKIFSGNNEFLIVKNSSSSKKRKPSFLDKEVKNKSLEGYAENNFLIFCKKFFPAQEVDILAKIYGIGTSNHFNGNSTIFWQIDLNGKVRDGKIMKYNPISGKRLKKPQVYQDANWESYRMSIRHFSREPCLFGLNLIVENSKPIIIVESEKTAFLMALYDNSRNYLATGGKNGFNYEMLKCLVGRKVTAYPDNGEYHLWNSKIEDFNKFGLQIKISDNFNGPNYPKGWDLADELLQNLTTKNSAQDSIGKEHYRNINLVKDEAPIYGELFSIAKKLIGENNSMNKNQLIKIIQYSIDLSDNDAGDLIDKMFQNKIIDITPFKTYYLYDSCPY